MSKTPAIKSLSEFYCLIPHSTHVKFTLMSWLIISAITRSHVDILHSLSKILWVGYKFARLTESLEQSMAESVVVVCFFWTILGSKSMQLFGSRLYILLWTNDRIASDIIIQL